MDIDSNEVFSGAVLKCAVLNYCSVQFHVQFDVFSLNDINAFLSIVNCGMNAI